ncbi:MAG: T9SS type A sorting domain-containing protein [Bacteroidota bacterium]
MKTILLSITALTFAFQLAAQGEYDKCYFGNAGVDFGSWFPAVLTDSEMTTFETAATMCSAQGDLLFYSNGGNSPTVPNTTGAVWNANHEIMENGLLGDSSGCISSYQGAVAFPFQGTSDKTGSNMYYIFMRDCAESSFSTPNYNSGLTYCEIDMDANNGLGKVVSKNNVVVPFQSGGSVKSNQEPVAAILHGNNQDWWVFSYHNDSLYSIQVSQNGIGQYRSYFTGERAIVFSPDREMVAVGHELYAFDAFTGNLSFVTSLPEARYAFSPNGQKLYGVNQTLTQYDVSSNDILNSAVNIASGVDGNQLYLAPDGRIYLFKNDATYLPGYIDCPNATGVNCGFSLSAIDLYNQNARRGFTNIPANYLYKENYDCNVHVEQQDAASDEFLLYPNPAKEQFNITYRGSEKTINYSIHSIDGKQVLSQITTHENTAIDVSQWNPGVYFLKSDKTVKKFIVQP